MQYEEENTHLTKRDRRRHQIQSKLMKLDLQFHDDKDYHYRDSLIQLQYKLSSLHSSDNPQFLQKVNDFKELRDSELMRLRLAEEYQVNFINETFKSDYENTVEETKKIIEMVKLRLNDKLVKKIKQLKEDKALIDIATSSTSTTSSHNSSRSRNINPDINNNSGYNSNLETSSSFFFSSERRSRRNKRHDNDNTSVNGSGEDSYDSNNTGGGANGGNGYGSSTTTRKRPKLNSNNGNTSSNTEDSNIRILTDNPKLNEFLYGEEFLKRKDKASNRYSTKGYQSCSSLKPEEINEDLAFLRNTLSAIKSKKK